jgi:cytochrome P450
LALLPYADKVVKESMRLYPPAWSLARTTVKETEIGGYRLPVGANVVMSPWIMHRDRRFFENPELFDPDRWSGQSPQQLPRFAYFPFGGGPRLCIGASFAVMETNILLATIAQRFQLHLIPGHPVTPQPGITLRPRHGVRVKMTRN